MAADPAADGLNHAAVLGSPISHSLSPRLHRAGYAALGLSNWRYDAHEVTEPEFAEFVAGLDDAWRGLSLTMPLKEVAFEIADSVSDIATRAGAINTLIRRSDGGWDADNTDVHGIIAALAEVQHDGSAVVIGAGATARSAVVALAELGISRLAVAARRPQAGEILVDFAAAQGIHATTVEVGAWATQGARLVASTVPASAQTDIVAMSDLNGAAADGVTAAADLSGVTVFDVAYAPWPSTLAHVVSSAGGEAISGLEMLIHQAHRQFELFTGQSVDLSVLRAAVEQP